MARRTSDGGRAIDNLKADVRDVMSVKGKKIRMVSGPMIAFCSLYMRFDESTVGCCVSRRHYHSHIWKRLECKEMTSTFLSQNLTFWNLHFFRFNRTSHFSSNLSQNFVMDKEHKSARHLFEQK
jgi:hypothetical protein